MTDHAEKDEVGDVLDGESTAQVFHRDVDGGASSLFVAHRLQRLPLRLRLLVVILRATAATGTTAETDERCRHVVVVIVAQQRRFLINQQRI